jgi:hypothetical protein
MESENSLLYSQQPDNENYPDTHEVKPQHNTLSFNRHYANKNNYRIIKILLSYMKVFMYFLQSYIQIKFTIEVRL